MGHRTICQHVIAPVVIMALVGGPTLAAPPAGAPKNRPTMTFSSVTAAKLTCIQNRSRTLYQTVYKTEASNAYAGTSETHTRGVTVKLAYALDPTNATITYTILSKPLFVPDDPIWAGIRDSIKACS